MSIVLFLSLEQRDRGGKGLLRPAKEYCTMFKNWSHFVYIRSLGWAPWELSQFPPTKSRGSISRHIAQFAGITLWRCRALCCPSRNLIHFFLYTFIAQIITIVLHNINLCNRILLQVIKINHITSCNDCEFILVLGVLEHTQTHGSVCWNRMSRDVWLMSIPILNV